MKFSIRDFFSECDQIRSFLGNWYIFLRILHGKLHFLYNVNLVMKEILEDLDFLSNQENFFRVQLNSVQLECLQIVTK